MSESSRQPDGFVYTATVALLTLAFVFCPALLLMASPVSYATLGWAALGSAICVGLAAATWKRASRRFVPSIVNLKHRLSR